MITGLLGAYVLLAPPTPLNQQQSFEYQVDSHYLKELASRLGLRLLKPSLVT